MNPKLLPAEAAFTRAARYSRAWSRVVSRAIARFGERPQGGSISGIYSEHLPENWQRGLRTLAKRITQEIDKAYALRPYRTRFSTMRNLHWSVKSRDGSGYYG
jgi:hypothetical protein